MPSVRVNGIDLYYEDSGSGPALVVAHGLMGSVAQMVQHGERLDLLAARGLRVIAYDARGHGRSGATYKRDDYTWQPHARDLHALILNLGLGRASVYGGSMGAGTALVLALEHPEAVERLVLRAPPPFDETIRDVLKPFAQVGALYRVLGTRLTARLVTALPSSRSAQRRTPRFDMYRFFASQQRRAAPLAVAALRHGPPLPVAQFAEIAHPALILTHPDDALHPLASGELLRERMPHARLAVAPSAMYWLDHADYLAEIVGAFVKGELSSAGAERTIIHAHRQPVE